MKNIRDFFDKAKEKGAINYEDEESALKNTIKIFDKADTLLNKAILDKNKTLKDKISNGQIDYSYISKAFISENFGGTVFKRPVVDLVQQGGGMHGIALLGYTYIMEKIGVRFYSHGGTSAGAINATFLAAISNDIYKEKSVFTDVKKIRQATKSEMLTHIIVNTSFGNFMGRKGIIGWFQSKIFKNRKIVKNILIFISLLFLALAYSFFGFFFSEKNGLNGHELRFYDLIIGTLNVFALLILAYILLVKMLGDKFGINSGKEFYNWADTLLTLLKVYDTEQLDTQLCTIKIEKNTAIANTNKDNPHCDPRLVLITSNLTHNRLVKFPEEAGDYWSNSRKIKPAAYLRATMSLPFIFKAFIPSIEHYKSRKQNDKVIMEARFVDGGMLSNFPIREFHRKDNNLPLFPTFGILLSKIGNSEDLAKKETNLSKKDSKINTSRKLKQIKLLEYIASFFKTFRSFYDSDFILNNKEIKNRVVLIKTEIDKNKPNGEHFNWLDFWMDKKTQKKLFLRGAEAAIEQIDKFNWNEYIEVRKELLKTLSDD